MAFLFKSTPKKNSTKSQRSSDGIPPSETFLEDVDPRDSPFAAQTLALVQNQTSLETEMQEIIRREGEHNFLLSELLNQANAGLIREEQLMKEEFKGVDSLIGVSDEFSSEFLRLFDEFNQKMVSLKSGIHSKQVEESSELGKLKQLYANLVTELNDEKKINVLIKETFKNQLLNLEKQLNYARQELEDRKNQNAKNLREKLEARQELKALSDKLEASNQATVDERENSKGLLSQIHVLNGQLDRFEEENARKNVDLERQLEESLRNVDELRSRVAEQENEMELRSSDALFLSEQLTQAKSENEDLAKQLHDADNSFDAIKAENEALGAEMDALEDINKKLEEELREERKKRATLRGLEENLERNTLELRERDEELNGKERELEELRRKLREESALLEEFNRKIADLEVQNVQLSDENATAEERLRQVDQERKQAQLELKEALNAQKSLESNERAALRKAKEEEERRESELNRLRSELSKELDSLSLQLQDSLEENQNLVNRNEELNLFYQENTEKAQDLGKKVVERNEILRELQENLKQAEEEKAALLKENDDLIDQLEANKNLFDERDEAVENLELWKERFAVAASQLRDFNDWVEKGANPDSLTEEGDLVADASDPLDVLRKNLIAMKRESNTFKYESQHLAAKVASLNDELARLTVALNHAERAEAERAQNLYDYQDIENKYMDCQVVLASKVEEWEAEVKKSDSLLKRLQQLESFISSYKRGAEVIEESSPLAKKRRRSEAVASSATPNTTPMGAFQFNVDGLSTVASPYVRKSTSAVQDSVVSVEEVTVVTKEITKKKPAAKKTTKKKEKEVGDVSESDVSEVSEAEEATGSARVGRSSTRRKKTVAQ
eukprot:TRINITY_DN4531_c0_g1_i1.p1 TRINITY_DN4531_c0_g1~~TRINITY_DN4531_c0_g1_i1.p1  ORF type:complete len:854 (-),score=446.70 TRINITY_DN4531_c0_g1_i1:71-2632(-)